MFHSTSRFDVVLLALLAASLLANVILAMRLSSAADHSAANAALEAWAPPRIPAGTKMPPLQVRNDRGQPVTVGFQDDDRPTVIYLLEPTCGWCRRNSANVAALAAQARAKFRFVGVATKQAGLADFLRHYPTPFPVFTQPDEQTHVAYQMGGVPRTLVVSTAGELLLDIPGAYLPHLQDEVQRFFAVRLPGLLQAEAAGNPTNSSSGTQGASPGSNCTDQLGQEFSPGWISEEGGKRQMCGQDGKWKLLTN